MQATPGDDWNEFRLILAVARAGGLAGAARALAIDHSTAFRRLQASEARLGLPLFERLAAGRYQPTVAGQRIAAAAERMEAEAMTLAREIAGRDQSLGGRLRVTSSETLAFRILPRHLAAFRHRHPGITIELAVENRVLSLTRREADVALRPMRPREGDLWGRKLGEIAWTVYGSPRYLKAHGRLSRPADLAAHALIGWEEGAEGINAAEWLARIAPADAVVYRANSLVNQFLAAQAGFGLAVLPCYLGDPGPALVRAIERPVPELTRELWIVTHTDLRRTPRVRAFFDLVGEGIAAERALLDGRNTGRATGRKPRHKSL